ncbi:hypothetical protein APHAL10511_001238 [Amanita phalloides]|nr:hypothetical protein APHAL10511_001238 [Amanita phalloides]
MNHSTRDSHPGTSKATSKDIYPPSAIKSDFEPSRHHRSASGYPSGPDYVSSSRRHAEKPSTRDHRPRIVSETQPNPPPTSHTRYREPDIPHIRSSHRKESTIDPTAYTSASKKYAHDSTAYRNNPSAEDVIQYPRMTYERWIPPNPPSPPSHQQEPHNRERGRDDRERDNHKLREGYHRERRDETDVKERHKRRHDEGDSEWDKERERRDRRDRERHKEWEKDRSKEQERERVKEEFVERTREKTAREKARGPEKYRDEREQERYAEKERQRAVEKEKGREKERDRERRRQKDREREQAKEGERKDKEKSDAPRLRTGLDRERRRDREVALPEREYWPEVEKGRESDREPDRRKKKVEWEVQREREREKAKEGPDRVGERGDVPVVMQNGRRLEVEHEGTRKVQETSRRYQAAFPAEGGLVPSVIREQDIERARRSKKDIDSSRQKEHERIHKASEQSETERARYTEKENVPRREHKSHYERTKPGSRPYADRATDSERENPSHREASISNIYQRETVFRGPVEPEFANLAVKSSIVAPKHPRDERAPYIGAITKATAPEPVPFSDLSRPTTANDGYMGHTVPAARLIDQIPSTTPKHSPISAAGADIPKLDVGVSDARVKQVSSSQRALRRQSKMSYLAPEPVAVLPPSHTTHKHGQSHVTAPQAPPSHVFRTDNEDVTRLNSSHGPVDSSPILLPPMNSAVPTKLDARVIAPMHRTTSNSQNINGTRPPGRNLNVTVHLSSVQDNANIVTPPIISRDARVNASPDVQVSTRTGNDSDARQKTNALPNMSQANVDDGVDSMHQVTSEQIAPRPMSRSQIDKLAKHSGHEFDTPMSVPAVAHSIPSTSGATSNATIKTSSKGIVKTPNAGAAHVTDPETKVTAVERSRTGLQPVLPAVPLLEVQQDLKREIGPYPHKLQSSSEIPLHRPPSAAGWTNQQESIKDKVSAASNPTGPAPHSAERSVAVEGQLISPNVLPASAIRRPTTGLFVSKQEGFFSRIHTKTPIPEIASTSTANHPPSDVPFESSIQCDTATSDRRGQSEPTTAPPMDSRSIGLAAFTRPQSSKGPGDESAQNRKNLIDPHRSADSECVLSDQRGDGYGHVNMPHSQEQPHLESSQSHSPAASLHCNVPVQPLNTPSNVVDFVQGPLKPQTTNHSRNLESSQPHSPATSLRRNAPVQPLNTPSNAVDFVQGPLKPQTTNHSRNLEPSQPHSPATSLRRNALVQPLNTPSNAVDFVQGSLKPQATNHSRNLESSQPHSPATSLRRNAPVQPLNTPSNAVDFVQGPLKPQTTNHSRNYSSSAKAGEDFVPVASQTLPPRPIEDIRGVPNLHHSDIGTPPSTRDFRATARARNDRAIDAGYHTEREAMIPSINSVSANGASHANQLDSTLSSAFQDKNVKSTLHSHHTEHRRSPKTSHQFVDDAAHESNSVRKQWKEVTEDKNNQLHVANSSSDVNPPEAKQDKPNASHPTGDKKPVILHEGLARILDQPLDRHIKKTRTSPSTHSSQSGLPREDSHAHEHDRRQPSYGTPRTMPRSSPSMSHKTPSPIVKTLNHGMNLNNPHTNQETHSKETYHRSNASATEYPHSIYRSSSVYPTVGTSASHVLHEPSKNQAHLSHSLPVHGSLHSSTIEIIHPSNSSPRHGNTLTSHSLMPTAYNQRPSAVAIKNSDSASIKIPQPPNTQAKAQSGGPPIDIAQLHQSKVPDTNYRIPDSANDRPVLNEAGRTDHGSHIQESSPDVAPVASLLFSKSVDHHGSLEQKGSIVNPIAISNHSVRGTNNIHTPSPTSQELERHEPRLITPKIQKHAELLEEPRRKSYSLDVAKSTPPEEGHKKSASPDTTKSKSQEPPQIWYPPVSYRDSSYEGKHRSQLTSVTEPVAQKNVPTALSVNDGRGKTGVEQVKPGRKSPNIANMKVYRYLREKRNRTISAMSMEAQDGTAPSTVVGSPTASVISQAPIFVPSPRDPMKAAQDWLTEGIEAAIRAEAQGRRRILRPGVVFDVGEDPPREEQRHRSKRPRAQKR